MGVVYITRDLILILKDLFADRLFMLLLIIGELCIVVSSYFLISKFLN